ncbi:MAG: 50S ribosomal protein L4 [Candidatus Aenigmarchaeota archaeon]|nr:50S ribosomal protein L4 [Candidatus Aenigmarchaeota archaeon]
MKVDVLNLEGRPVEKIELPKVFEEPVREDLVTRAVLASQRNIRQVYSPNPMAGKRTSAHYHGTRRKRYSMMNKETARLPRLHARTVPFLNMRARFVPQAVGGRKAHPPKAERVWEQKINRKEKKKAIWSALAATAIKDLVLRRGHKVERVKEFPIVVDDKLQDLKKTQDVIKFMVKIGLEKELERISERKIRAGKGKARSRKYKIKSGPLIVVGNDNGINSAVRNISGCNVSNVDNLSAEKLAPGASLGRLTIFTKSAIEKLNGLSNEN